MSRKPAPPAETGGPAIRKAVHAGGGRSLVSKALQRSVQAIGFWYHDPSRLDAVIARKLSKLAGYRIPVSLMRPDVFGDLSVRELGYVPPAEPKP